MAQRTVPPLRAAEWTIVVATGIQPQTLHQNRLSA